MSAPSETNASISGEIGRRESWSLAAASIVPGTQAREIYGADDSFSAEAVATLTRFAGGVPRTVVTLARLALVAAAGDGAERVDAATVERVWRELAPTWTDERPHADVFASPRAPVVGGDALHDRKEPGLQR